jgi:Mn-containing catalase
MTREIAHQKSFEKALYSIEPNFPVGKLPGDPRFTDVYFSMSQGAGESRGPWNEGDKWTYVDQRDAQMAVDGGNGEAAVGMDSADMALVQQMAARTASNTASDPLTGAELGMGVVPNGGNALRGSKVVPPAIDPTVTKH